MGDDLFLFVGEKVVGIGNSFVLLLMLKEGGGFCQGGDVGR